MAEGAITRRRFLEGAGAAGVAIAGATVWRTAPAAAQARRVAAVDTPIRHLVIACQENRSFDHYYGYAPAVQAAGFGPPAGYYQPDSSAGTHYPFEFVALSTPDPPHSWTAVHQQYDGGAMDGFWQAAQDDIGDGDAAIGYYTASELPFYYSLFENSALCANYHCSLLGPTRVAPVGKRGLPADLRRARRVLRPRRAAPARRVRAERQGAALGDLAVREGRPGSVEPSGRAHLDAEADRGAARTAAAVEREPPVRLRDADRRQLPGERRARTTTRRSRRHQRLARPVHLLVTKGIT